MKIKRQKNEVNNSPASLTKAMNRNRFIITSLVLITCLVTTYFIWNAANANREKELRSYFEFRIREINTRIEQRLTSYEQILRSTRGLFDVSAKVNRAEFHSFVNSMRLNKNYPGIQGVGFSLIIPSTSLKENIYNIRKEGFPKYKIWPEGKRETYTSIIYLEPFSNLNLRAFGYDMFSEPVRRKAMETARDSNTPAASGKIKLVQETGKSVQAGFLIYLPVYKNGTPYSNVSERRTNIIGWVYSPFRMDDFMKGLFGERAADIDLEIYDTKNISLETKMYDSKTDTAKMNQLVLRKGIIFNGHTWTVLVKSTPQLESRIGAGNANLILIIGLSISFLLAIITLLVENKRRQTILSNAERERTESRLLKSEKRYRGLFESAKDGIIILDAYTGKIVDVNPYLIEMLGYSHEELLVKELWEIGTFKNIAASKEAFLELQNKGYVRFEDMPLKTKNGQHIEVEFISNTYFVDNTKIIQCNIRNITERKLAEMKLKESEAKLTDAMKIAKLSTWEYNFALDRFTFPDQSFSLINTTAEHEGGNIMSSEQFAQKYIYPEDRVLIEKEIRKAFETPDPAYTSYMEYRVIFAPGEIGYFAANVRIEKDADNRTLKALGVNQDITDRKRMEEIVLRINKAVESSGEAICMSDPQGHHFYHNKAFTEIFKYTVEEVQAAGGGITVYVNKDVGRKVFDTIMEGGTWNGEVEMSSKSGRKFIVLLRADSIKNENGIIVGLVGIHTDITERKRAEESLRFFRMMIDKSQDAIEVIDVETARFIDVNEKACTGLGYSRSELLNMSVFDIDPNQNMQDFQQMIQNIRQSNSMTVESLHRRKDGSLFPVEINIAVVKLEKTYTIAIVRDITEKKLIENKLKRSEEQLKEAQSVGLIGSWEWDIVKNTGTMSDEMYKIFNINSSSFDVTIESFLETAIPEDRKMVQEIIMRSMKTHESTAFDFRTITPRGEIRWIHEKSTIEVDDKGNPKRVFGTSQDITERKLAELKLKESERRTKALLNANPDMIFRMNREGFFLDYKADTAELYAQTETSIIGKKNRDITPPEFADLIERYIGQTLDSGELQEFEYKMIAQKRGLRDYEARMVPSGKDEIIAVVRDITDRKRVEEELKISEIKFRNIVEGTRAILFSVNKRGQFTYLNEAACNKLGMNNRDLIGKFYLKFVHIESRSETHSTFSEQILNPTPNISVDVRIMPKSGNNIWLNLLVNPIYKDGNIEGLSAVGLDITDRKKIEEEIKLKNDQLIKLDAEKDKFFSIIAHDLKSPFNGFLNLTELMADSNEKFSLAEFTEKSKMLNEAARNLYKLLENLLEWSQVKKGSIIYTPKDIALVKLVLQSINTINPRAVQKGITIINDAVDVQNIYADEKMIGTILRNLLSNAVKFTRTGGKVIVKSERSNNGTIEISVTDNGIGIAENDIKRLFKVEEKVSSKGTDGESSTGLGLILCKEFVNMHGGKIWVESEEGKGSTFYFTLRERK